MRNASAGVLACLFLTMCSSEKPAQSPEGAAPAETAPAPPPPGTAASPADQPDFPPQASRDWIVTPAGVGPVRFGMTVAEVRSALRDSLAALPADGSCAVVAPPGAPAGLTLMFENGRVVRADVDQPTVATDHGVMVGMSRVVVGGRYHDSVTATPHKYDPKAEYLTYTSPASADQRVVFEVSGGVQRFRAGVLPAVEYVERCG